MNKKIACIKIKKGKINFPLSFLLLLLLLG